MSETPFYKTRMGQRYYEHTMPELVKQLERLASDVQGRRDPAVQELIDSAGNLVEAAENVMNTEIVLGSPRTRTVFDSLRTNAAHLRRLLAGIQ